MTSLSPDFMVWGNTGHQKWYKAAFQSTAGHMPQETGSELPPKPKTKKEAATMQGPVGPQSPGSIGWSNSVLRTDTDQHKIPSPSCIHDREERLAAQSRCRVVREGFQAESSWPWRGKPEQKQPSPAAIDGYNMRLSGVHRLRHAGSVAQHSPTQRTGSISIWRARSARHIHRGVPPTTASK
jgi:hypothetical protein